jgi:nucleoid-associated protein YgaU
MLRKKTGNYMATRSWSMTFSLLSLARAPIRNLFRIVAVLVFASGCATVELEPELALASDEDSVEEIDVAELDAALARLIRDLEAAIEATRVADKNTKKAVLAEDGTYLVKPGDYLDKIIKQTAGNSRIRPSILRRAFVRANPSAFKRSNPNWMLANKRLKVPDVDDIKKVIFKDIDPNKAKARGIDPYEGWIQYP